MSLSLNFTICLKDNCTKATVKDTTGRYDASSNTGGWGSPNDDYAAVTSATIVLKDSSDTVIQTETVTSQITGIATLPDVIQFDDITLAAYSDGIMKIVYTVVTSSGTFTKSITKLFFCTARCSVDKLWAKVASKACANCDCDLDDIIEDAIKAEALLYSFSNGGKCNDTSAISEILTMISRLTDSDDCSCS